MDRAGSGLEFRFFAASSPDAHRVPAKVLADSLVHAQRAVHLLAISAAGREIRQRARVPAELASQFVLECGVPAAGSYVQPVRLRTRGEVFDAEVGAPVLEAFTQIGHALSDGNWNSIRSLVPDRAVRNRVIDEFVAMLPDPDEGWVMDLRDGSSRTARFDPERIRAIQQYQFNSRRPSEAVASPDTVTGELVRIDFAEHKLTIRHYPTHRRLECEYRPDTEEMLVENRRGLIRVTGLVELDEHDLPLRLTDVFEIRELDVSPIIVEYVRGARRSLWFRDGGRAFEVRLDEDGQLLVVTDAELDVHVFGRTRTEVVAELLDQLQMMWLEYAEADEAQLTPGAASLRRTLRDRITVHIDDA